MICESQMISFLSTKNYLQNILKKLFKVGSKMVTHDIL